MVSSHCDSKCLLPTPLTPCERTESAAGADPQWHLWPDHCCNHTGLGACLWLAQFPAFSLNLMSQGTELHCLSKNHFMSLLLWLLADVICFLYYLVKMLISQPQWGVASVIDFTSLPNMLKSLSNLRAMLAKVPAFLICHRESDGDKSVQAEPCHRHPSCIMG